MTEAARPPAARESRRELIVEDASRIFSARGVRAVGVDSLVEEIGVAKMTLYKHFRSKDELIVACLRRIDERYRVWIESRLSGDDPVERVLQIFDALHDWFVSPEFRGCAFVNATIELADPDHPASHAVLDHKRHTRDWVSRLVAGCGIDDTGFVARQLVLLMEGAISTALVEHDPDAALVARATARQVLAAAPRNAI
jgi:AcrR family transcriptional regulator